MERGFGDRQRVRCDLAAAIAGIEPADLAQRFAGDFLQADRHRVSLR